MIARHGGRGHGGGERPQYDPSRPPAPAPGVTPQKTSAGTEEDRRRGRAALESTVRVLMQGGEWQIPPEERPPLLRPETGPPEEKPKRKRKRTP